MLTSLRQLPPTTPTSLTLRVRRREWRVCFPEPLPRRGKFNLRLKPRSRRLELHLRKEAPLVALGNSCSCQFDCAGGSCNPKHSRRLVMRACLTAVGSLVVVLSLTALSSSADTPYKVQARYSVSGDGSFDCLTLDSSTRRLYVSHATQV